MTDNPRLMESDITPPCTCTVTGPGYDETTTDPACPYHGEDGSMVVTIRATAPYFGGRISRDDPRLGHERRPGAPRNYPRPPYDDPDAR